MTLEILTADRWLYSILTTDTGINTELGGRVFIDVAPEGTTFPLAVISSVSRMPVANMFQDRIMDDEVWQIRLVTDQPNYEELEDAVEEIYDALHKQEDYPNGIAACYDIGTTRYSELEHNRIYKHIVMEFRIYSQ